MEKHIVPVKMCLDEASLLKRELTLNPELVPNNRSIPIRGVAIGGIWVYIPPTSPPPKKKSVQVNFLWGKNDDRTAIEHE